MRTEHMSPITRRLQTAVGRRAQPAKSRAGDRPPARGWNREARGPGSKQTSAF